ncbi:hypothetical protein, partial [Escherichia coli]|uniref:hypothetical protein n=1 Tax=Escherichia coli TaxID=562 RepID=UPI001CDA811D
GSLSSQIKYSPGNPGRFSKYPFRYTVRIGTMRTQLHSSHDPEYVHFLPDSFFFYSLMFKA